MTRTLKILLVVLALVLALPVALIAGLHTRPGEALLARVLNASLASPEQTITIADPRIDWGGHVRLAEVRVADAQGPWLTARGVEMRWRPLSLLTGTFYVDEVAVAETVVDRPPVPAATDVADATSPEAEGGFSSPVEVVVENLRLGDVVLGEAVAGGAPVRLTVDGRASMKAEPAALEASLDIRRDDDIAGRLTAEANFRPGNGVLQFRLRASEPRGGLIARVADLGELPALEIELTGEGPLTDWRSELSVALDGVQTVTGSAALTAADTAEVGHARTLTFSLHGDLERLTPVGLKPLFAGSTTASGDIVLDTAFLPRTGTLKAETGAFSLDGSLERDEEKVAGRLVGGLRTPVDLALGDRPLKARSLAIDATVSGNEGAADWSMSVEASGLETTEGQVERLSLRAGGENAVLTAEGRSIPVRATLSGTLGQTADTRLSHLEGPISGDIALMIGEAGAVRVDQLTFGAPGLALEATGERTAGDARATGTLELSDLAPYSRLAGQPLSGSARLAFEAQGDPASGAATVTLRGEGQDVALGIARLDPLLAGTLALSADLGRSAEGVVTAESVTIEGDHLSLAATGTSDLDTVQASVQARIAELNRVDPGLQGAVEIAAEITGKVAGPKVVLSGTGESLQAAGEAIEDLDLDAEIIAAPELPSGTFALTARFRGQPLTLKAALSTDETGVKRLRDITLSAGATRVSGDLALDAAGKPSGALDIRSPDLSEIAPLLLQQLSGSLSAQVEIGETEGRTVATVRASAADLVRDDLRIEAADLSATIADPLEVPQVDGTLTARGLRAGGTLVKTLEAKAAGTQAGTEFSLDADLADGALSVEGSALREGEGARITLARAEGALQGVKTRLTAPAVIAVDGAGTARIESARLALGGGSVAVAGSAGERLDMRIDLAAVPASIVNSFASGLGLSGAISGTATVTGAAAAPVAGWEITWTGVEANGVAALGLPNATLKSSGRFENGRIRQTSVLSTGAGGSLRAEGTVGLGQGGGGLDLSVRGELPFVLARRQLTRSSLRLDGAANVNLTVTGPLVNPAVNGTISTENATAVSLNTGLVLKDLSATANVSRSEIRIASLKGTIGGGGSVTGSGTIGLGEGLPADLKLAIRDGVYSDGRIVSARIDAELALKGPLAGNSTVTGEVTLRQADVTIPQTLPTSLAPVQVEHVNAPGDVARQSQSLRRGPKEASGTGASLDVRVSAPNGGIFVRGRGLQAELGGAIRVRGTTANPVTSGAFTLRRGTLTVLSRLLTFTKGTITFLGNFDPLLDFAATTATSGATVTVSVSGNASDPKVAFSSAPDMPQEEILALLLFGQNLSSLSAAQVAQLASAVAALGGADPLDKLRQSLGVDSINITADENNNATVELRKRLNDKVSVGVQQGSGEGSSKVTVDIDVTKSIRARGETDANGSTKAGIFFEREY